jgi:4-amino-4-deoxy-L-arabinose transferase-like glycosyltransferase
MRTLVICLAVLGAVVCLRLFSWEQIGILPPIIVAAAACIAMIGPLARPLAALLRRGDEFLKAHNTVTIVAVGAVALMFLALRAARFHEQLFLRFHDEHAYWIQARMVAQGRLWHAAYPPDIAPFFDTFNLIVDRVYAPMYFPGTALALAPAVWLGIPYWTMPLLISAGCAIMIYLVTSELFGGVRALIAVLLLLCLHQFAALSTMAMSQPPLLLAELLLLWGWLRFVASGRVGWAILIGAAAGYAAITRPLDAACVALPVGVAMLVQLRQRPRILLRTGSIIFVSAAPFLVLQIVQNIGITGSWRQFPESYYNRENFPASPIGFHAIDPANIPHLTCPPKRQWLDDWIIPVFRAHQFSNLLWQWWPVRLRQTFGDTLPDPALLILLAPAALGLSDPRRRTIAAWFVLFLVGYALYAFYLDHYLVALMPAVILLLMCGWEAIASAWPRQRAAIDVIMALSLPAIALGAMLDWNGYSAAPEQAFIFQRTANYALAHLPRSPAVVLFRFDPPLSYYHDEPVFNDDAAWPDDAPIVRARDLGPVEDRKLFRYYAQRQPDRVFFIYDPESIARVGNPLSRPLGTARQLTAAGQRD